MVIYGVGWRRWGTITICHATVPPPHKNVSNTNVRMKPSIIQNLQEHFNSLKNMAEVSATRTVQQITGQVNLHDDDDKKVYLSSWMSKRGCYLSYSMDQGYAVNVIIFS